jgi:Fe-S cluster assembly ATP-binding protein
MAVLDQSSRCSTKLIQGLDIDALRIVAAGVNKLLTPDNAIILVTHYQRLLNYIVPHYVHVLAGGRIAREGGKDWHSSSRRKVTTGSRRRRRTAARQS